MARSREEVLQNSSLNKRVKERFCYLSFEFVTACLLVDHLFSGIHSSKPGGTGIGLSSAKQIMQGMNGDISARLVDGDCIEFVLSFPK